jgi:hypothetical protein
MDINMPTFISSHHLQKGSKFWTSMLYVWFFKPPKFLGRIELLWKSKISPDRDTGDKKKINPLKEDRA